MSAESIFEPGSIKVRRRLAKSLLNDYSHPWDVLAEAVQNSVDAINRRYRQQIAAHLGIERDALEVAIAKAADQVITADKVIHDTEYPKWTSPEYIDGQRERWFELLGRELTQEKDALRAAYNSVEASYKGKISIARVDHARKLVVKDNGIGMSFEELKQAVKKGVTLKGGYSDIGELGNGLTYLIAACDDFQLETCNGQEHSLVNIKNMHSWIMDENSTTGLKEPLSDPQKKELKEDPYTVVTMGEIRNVASDYPDIFDPVIITERFIHLSRTKTAIGHVYDLLHFPVHDVLRSPNIEVEFKDTIGGTTREKRIEFGYRSPSKVLRDLHAGAAPPLMTLDEAHAQLKARADIGGNGIWHVGIWSSASGIPLYYACFIANREWYREASQKAQLCDRPDAPDLRNIGRHDITPCIELGVKGMPTGVTVDPPITGFQGYWANFHTIILDNRLTFDEGRKTPVGRRVTMYRDCADYALFEKIGTEIIQRAIKDAIVPMNLAQMATAKQDFIKKRLKGRTPLSYSKVRSQNAPKYEQDVVALFHEMIAAGVLPYYHVLDCSSNSTYDAIFKYSIPKNRLGVIVQRVEGRTGILEEEIVLEFKHKGENVIEDIAGNVKFYYMIDLLVCWEVSAAECRRQMASLIPKPLNKVKYWGTTHELQLNPSHFMQVGSGRSLDVICLKELIQKVEASTYNVSGG